MKVNFNGFNEKTATLACDNTVQAGKPVTLSENGTVTAAASGSVPAGIAKAVREGYAAVQLHGYVTVPYSGTLTLGLCNVQADSAGGIAKNTAGRAAIVLDIDTTAKTAGIDLI